LVTPAALVLLGDRLDSFDVRRLARRALGRAEPKPVPVEQRFWFRSASCVMHKVIPLGLAGVALLLLLGAPFLSVRWGFPDDRVLPTTASAHQVGDQLRRDFVHNSDAAVTIVVPDTNGVSATDIDIYAAALSRVADVTGVSAPTGTFVDGNRVGPPSARAAQVSGSAYLTAVVTFVLLFLLTGSIVMPLKALVLNILSLTAAFGAMVWIFQDGHLGALGTTPTGTLVANIPVLLFCIAFGLSMDYEVFLVSRIREF
jgi:putative drug exporter of the RND superfamily